MAPLEWARGSLSSLTLSSVQPRPALGPRTLRCAEWGEKQAIPHTGVWPQRLVNRCLQQGHNHILV